MYEGDSFFTLSIGGQAGLAALSTVFAAVMVGLTWALARGSPIWLRVVIWAVLFTAFIWLSPQGYYTYYRLIIDGLPAQWVIGDLPRPGEVLAFLTFTGRANLSAHSTGVLGWLMLAAAMWRWRVDRGGGSAET